jgi:hypothetical protein
LWRRSWFAPQKCDRDCTEYNKALNMLDTWQRIPLTARDCYYNSLTSSVWFLFPKHVILFYWGGIRPWNFKILVLNFHDSFCYWVQWTFLILNNVIIINSIFL